MVYIYIKRRKTSHFEKGGICLRTDDSLCGHEIFTERDRRKETCMRFTRKRSGCKADLFPSRKRRQPFFAMRTGCSTSYSVAAPSASWKEYTASKLLVTNGGGYRSRECFFSIIYRIAGKFKLHLPIEISGAPENFVVVVRSNAKSRLVIQKVRLFNCVSSGY